MPFKSQYSLSNKISMLSKSALDNQIKFKATQVVININKSNIYPNLL